MNEKKFASIILGVAIVASSLILSFGFKGIMHTDRTVSVRGLDEREVDADTAVWNLSFSLGGNDLPTLQKNILSATETVKAFLASQGLSDGDVSVLAPRITDTTVNVYADASKQKFAYVAQQPFLVRTANIAAAKKAYASTLELMGKDISVSESYIQYLFDGLNDIKPAMIQAATENARLAAEQFAKNSRSKVGKIQSATQGLFTIEDAAQGLEERKKVRVVTTVVYALAD